MSANRKLRIALIVLSWSRMIQRPRHWQKQAVARGHHVEVFTVYRPLSALWRQPFQRKDAAIHRLSRNWWGLLLARLGWAQRIDGSLFHRFSRYIQGQVMDRLGSEFDAAIYCAAPVPDLRHRRRGGVLVYDCLDDWRGFPGHPPETESWERELAAQADLIIAVSAPLAERLGVQHGRDKVAVVANGCEYELFAAHGGASPAPPPSWVIGYTGSIDAWFDWDAVRAIALAYPQAQVQLVGPAKNIPAGLPANVLLLGQQPYERMPEFVAGFAVCLIPFRADISYVASVSPIKLYEYLAGGRPVVSSPMPDPVQLAAEGIVLLARSPEEFVAAVGRAAELARDPALIARRQAIARQNSWAARWRQVERRILEILDGRSGVSGKETASYA